jgi:hypothetical protein
MKSTIDSAESSYMLKSGYPMGHPRVGKNTRVHARFVSSRVRVAPAGQKLCPYLIPVLKLSSLLPPAASGVLSNHANFWKFDDVTGGRHNRDHIPTVNGSELSANACRC